MAGKSYQEGLTLVQMMDMFPTDETATKWFEDCLWTEHRHCGKCGSTNTKEVPNAKPMPYWCSDCRSYFSVRTGTPMARSNVPMRQMGDCNLSVSDKPQIRIQRQIRQGYRCQAGNRLVHDASYPGSVGM